VISSYRTSVVQLRFMNGATTQAVMNAFVTKFESDLFTTSPTVTITLESSDTPFFRSPSAVTVNTAGFSAVGTPLVQDDISTAPHGFRFQILFSASTSLWQMRKQDSEWYFNITYNFISGDNLYFSSEGDNKYLYVVRSGVTTYLMDKISAYSQWPLIFPGQNIWTASGGTFSWVAMTHYSTFWGV